MPTLLEAIVEARQQRYAAERTFRAALTAAKTVHSWAELAGAAKLSPAGVRYLVEDLNARRKAAPENPVTPERKP